MTHTSVPVEVHSQVGKEASYMVAPDVQHVDAHPVEDKGKQVVHEEDP